MTTRFRPNSALAVLTAALALSITAVSAQAPQVKKAPDAYNNIQVLKDLDADQVQPAMTLIAASLGVECAFCHVANAPEKDDKPEKVTARKMLRMTRDLNASAFDGRTEITCFSCHRGAHQPVPVPVIGASDAPPAPPAQAPAALPTPDQVLSKYTEAIGGAAALGKITTRVEKGTINVGAMHIPIDVFAKAPNKRITVTHSGTSESMTAFDGTIGWLGNTGRPAREMNPMETEDAGLDAVFAMALDARRIFSDLRSVPAEQVGGKTMTVLQGRGPNAPVTKLYFDPESGLLMRLERFDDTGIGGLPVQIDYADYREADGVRIPFQWTLARTNGRFTIQIDSVQQNVPIDDARFAKPKG